MQAQKKDRDGKHSYTGRAIFLGASIGLIVGLLLFNNAPAGMGIGAALGVIAGAVVDAQRGKTG